MVVTTEIPTLPPMLRARFISPEAALFLSLGKKEYAAVLMGTKRKAMPAAWITRAYTTVRKSTPRSNRVMWKRENDKTHKPKIISRRASYFDSRNPTRGIKSMMVNPPGIKAKPDCWAVYPSMVCINKGNKRVLPSSAKPSMNMRKFAAAKVRSRKRWRSMMGSVRVHSQKITKRSEHTEMMAKAIMRWDSN